MNSETNYIPFPNPIDYDLDSSFQNIPPNESSGYVQLKDSINRLSKSLTNIIYNAQSLEDYSNFYQSNPLKYENLYQLKLKNFKNGQLTFKEDYTNFITASMNYYQQLSQNLNAYQIPSNGYADITDNYQ